MQRRYILAACICGFILLGGIAYYLISGTTLSKYDNSPSQTNGTYKVRIVSEKQEYQLGDELVFNATVKNISGKSRTETFGSTCTDGNLLIDGDSVSNIRACGQALTDVTFKRGETITSKLRYPSASVDEQNRDPWILRVRGTLLLKPGTHTAQYSWGGVEAPKITFNVVE